MRWHAPGEATVVHAEVDLRVGGTWSVRMRGPDGKEHHAEGEYREIEAPARLVYTWRWAHAREEETLVTVEFDAQGDGTEVVLTHSGFTTNESSAGHEAGWVGCLAKLEALD